MVELHDIAEEGNPSHPWGTFAELIQYGLELSRTVTEESFYKRGLLIAYKH